jgi:hypothetical protein
MHRAHYPRLVAASDRRRATPMLRRRAPRAIREEARHCAQARAFEGRTVRQPLSSSCCQRSPSEQGSRSRKSSTGKSSPSFWSMRHSCLTVCVCWRAGRGNPSRSCLKILRLGIWKASNGEPGKIVKNEFGLTLMNFVCHSFGLSDGRGGEPTEAERKANKLGRGLASAGCPSAGYLSISGVSAPRRGKGHAAPFDAWI